MKMKNDDSNIFNYKYEILYITKMQAKYNYTPLKFPPEVNLNWGWIQLELKNVNAGIANGIRRVAMQNIPVKAMIANIQELESTDPEVRRLYSVIRDNIGLVALDQKIDEATEFSIELKNTTDFDMTVKSDHIKVVKGKITESNYILKGVALFKLAPKCSFRCGIFVRKNTALDSVYHTITRKIKYKVTDFIDVDILNYTGNTSEGMVKREDLSDLLPGLTKKPLHELKVLIIPDINYEKRYPQKFLENPKLFYDKYDVVIKNPRCNTDPELHPMQWDNNFIYNYSSTEAMPRDFELNFKVFGNIPPKDYIYLIFDTFIQKLTTIKSQFTRPEKVQNQSTYEYSRYLFFGENETFANIIRHAMFALDPDISHLRMEKIHKTIDMIAIHFIHPDGEKLLFNAIDKSIKDLETLRDMI